MISILVFKILSAVVITATGFAASYWPLKRMVLHTKHDSDDVHEHALTPHIAEAIAGGLFLGIALFHLWPEAISDNQFLGFHSAAIGGAIVLCGLTSFWWLLEKSSQWLATHQLHDAAISPKTYAFITALAVHAFLEGLTLGTSLEWLQSLMIFIAIMVHKSGECFAFTVHIRKHIKKINVQASVVYIFIALTPVAILLGTWGLNFFIGKWISWLLMLAASVLLYIAMTHNLVHVLHDHHHRFLLTTLFILGFTAMALLALFV